MFWSPLAELTTSTRNSEAAPTGAASHLSLSWAQRAEPAPTALLARHCRARCRKRAVEVRSTFGTFVALAWTGARWSLSTIESILSGSIAAICLAFVFVDDDLAGQERFDAHRKYCPNGAPPCPLISAPADAAARLEQAPSGALVASRWRPQNQHDHTATTATAPSSRSFGLHQARLCQPFPELLIGLVRLARDYAKSGTATGTGHSNRHARRPWVTAS